MVHLDPELLFEGGAEEMEERLPDPESIVADLYAEREAGLPEDFFDAVELREPEDFITFRGTYATAFDRRSWTEERELPDEAFHSQEYVDPPTGTLQIAEFEDFLDEEQLSIESHQFGVCSACDGESDWVCEQCDGTERLGCDRCSETGRVDCEECDGDARVTCPDCEWDGETRCDTCEGEGQRLVKQSCPNCTNGTIRTKETCSRCQGSGKIEVDGEEEKNCPRCSSSMYSRGTVKVDSACPECKGNGTTSHRTACENCETTGRVTCDTCEHSGTVRCDDCNGEGKTNCDDCGGSGEQPCERCTDGRVTCDVCEGDGETHQLEVRRTVFRPDSQEMPSDDLPYGIDDPEWTNREPFYQTEVTRGDANAVEEATDVDIDQLLDGEYTRIDVEYVIGREVTYDYHDQNFSVRAVDDDVFYTRYPEPEPEATGGLIATIKGLF